MTINERFKIIIETLFEGNKRAFSIKIGVNPTVIENVVGKRMGKPSYDVLEKICANANISPNWLLTGEGEMTNTPDRDSIIKSTTADSGIPLIPIDAMAGIFTGEQTVMLDECEKFIVPAFRNADFLIHVRGDSMFPKYQSGDLVACKMLSLTDLFFQWGKAYVINTDQGALIKKVQPGKNEETVRLVSENPEYKPFEIPRSCIYQIALVQGIIRVE